MLDLIAKILTVERDRLPRPENLNFPSERQFPDFDHQKKSPRTRNNVPITLSIVGRGMLRDTLDPNYHPKRLRDMQRKSASIFF